MSRVKLRSRDMALLDRLSRAPVEIGALPAGSFARLSALGLVRRVLGSCEITRTGQLTLHRQHFLKSSTKRIARVTRRNPLFLQEARFTTPGGGMGLSEILGVRRRLDSRIRQATRLPRWLTRLAAETAGQFRAVDEKPPVPLAWAQSNLKREPR